jgi:hypothetical protein
MFFPEFHPLIVSFNRRQRGSIKIVYFDDKFFMAGNQYLFIAHHVFEVSPGEQLPSLAYLSDGFLPVDFLYLIKG